MPWDPEDLGDDLIGRLGREGRAHQLLADLLDEGQRRQGTSAVPEGFAQYHGKRIAIVLIYGDRPTMFWGAAQYQDDELLGPVLRIRLQGGKSPSETDVIIAEKEWSGCIEQDTLYGCDFCFIPGQGGAARDGNVGRTRGGWNWRQAIRQVGFFCPRRRDAGAGGEAAPDADVPELRMGQIRAPQH